MLPGLHFLTYFFHKYIFLSLIIDFRLYTHSELSSVYETWIDVFFSVYRNHINATLLRPLYEFIDASNTVRPSTKIWHNYISWTLNYFDLYYWDTTHLKKRNLQKQINEQSEIIKNGQYLAMQIFSLSLRLLVWTCELIIDDGF